MFYFPADCPTCRRPQTFVVTSIGEYRVLDEKRVVPVQHFVPGKPAKQVSLMSTYGSGTCPNCRQPVLFVFKITFEQFKKANEAIQRNRQYTVNNAELIATYPSQVEYHVHKAYPENLKKPFIDLQIILDQDRSPAIIVAGCRMVLESAVNDLDAQGKNLWGKIENLVSQGVLSALLGEWAHLIRKEGNRAVHDFDATEKEAKEIVEFTRIFLDYAYVLPFRIKKHHS